MQELRKSCKSKTFQLKIKKNHRIPLPSLNNDENHENHRIPKYNYEINIFFEKSMR